MQRNVFERFPFEGFRTSKVESISVSGQGKRLFAGTAEGNLVLYENKIENTSVGTAFDIMKDLIIFLFF